MHYFKAKEIGVYIKNCLNFIQAAPKASRATFEPNPAVVSCTLLLCSSCAPDTSRIHWKSFPRDVPISQMEKIGKQPISPAHHSLRRGNSLSKPQAGCQWGRRQTGYKRRSCQSWDPGKTQHCWILGGSAGSSCLLAELKHQLRL